MVEEIYKQMMYRIYRDGKRVWSAYYEGNACEVLKCLSELYPDSEFTMKFE